MTNFPRVDADEGVTRQVLADHATMMMVSFQFQEGASGKLHSHPHVQSTYVKSGAFRFTMGEKQFDVGAGDSFIIPSGVTHGCVCLAPGELIDCFTPRRDDFL
ncbi:cupin domain-containing protein [Aliishimia ponticola]|uniref:Cupin domain-containing protein n=1 Tax=Aliishimia ponticola TaxID=2499833 RepID=A0A4S4ND41_9RHOB|nr:cupin domain-containing protein [Aliishimia ponticola]THH36675.1 cupin domain-containing protein [Aliishimia ponticola]